MGFIRGFAPYAEKIIYLIGLARERKSSGQNLFILVFKRCIKSSQKANVNAVSQEKVGTINPTHQSELVNIFQEGSVESRIAEWNGHSGAYSLTLDDGSDGIITFAPMTMNEFGYVVLRFVSDKTAML